VTFGDDKKGKVLGTGVIKVNDCFTLNNVALVDRLRYNLLSVSQLCDADLSVLFHKSDSHVLDSSGKRVCGISHIGNVFQANFLSHPVPRKKERSLHTCAQDVQITRTANNMVNR
jgi:hypothetical protein